MIKILPYKNGILCILFCLGIYANLLLADNAVLVDDSNSNEVNTIASIEVETLVKSTRSWDGNELPRYPDEQPEITILKITIPPGAILPMHKHPYINAGVLLEGELTVITQEEEILQLSAGDPIIEVVNKWHYGKNEGELPATILVFYAGVADSPITVQKETVKVEF